MTPKPQKAALMPIPFHEVEIMVPTYKAYAAKHPDFKEDTHVKCVWFDIVQIETMFKKLKEESADGLRVYFGRYPTDVSEFEDPKPIPDTNTVVFISTRINKNGVPKSDYFVDSIPMLPENRGEQCQPHCGGTDDGLA